MKVAIVTPAVRRGDGQGRVNLEIAVHAANLGHKVTIVATSVDEEIQLHPNVQVVRWNLSGIPVSLVRSQIASMLVQRWLFKNRGRFDVIHVNGSFTMAPCTVNTAHFVHGAWLRSSVHTSRIRSGLASLYYRVLTKLHAFQELRAFRNSRVVVAVSDRVRDEICDIGIPSEHIRVIRNGVDVREFTPGPSMRQTLGLPENVFLALFAGDMTTPRKNLDGVLRAVASSGDVQLVVVGSLRKNPYPEMAKALGISDRVHFLGFRRDIAAIMRSVDVFVFPSRYEACSLVMLEALASGLPVITARSAGGAEIVAEAGGIVIQDPEQIAAIAAAIASLRSDESLKLSMGAAARETACMHSWQIMAEHYMDLYAEFSKERLSNRS